MTEPFTGRLQFTGKKPAFTPSKGGFRLFTLDPGHKPLLLRVIKNPHPLLNH